jgi:hypothetical protein
MMGRATDWEDFYIHIDDKLQSCNIIVSTADKVSLIIKRETKMCHVVLVVAKLTESD